jgi:hypothetical protein
MRVSALMVAAATGVAGCGGSDIYYTPPGVAPPSVIRTVTIGTDVVVTPDDPGHAPGLFVDYMAGGSWRIQTICNVLEKLPCDYDPSQKCQPPTCPWDVVATALSGGLEVSSAAIDPSDRIFRVNEGAVRLMLDTADEIDAVHLTADPGEKLQIDVYLDYFYDASRVSWAGEDGTIETSGAPSDPVVFQPTAP